MANKIKQNTHGNKPNASFAEERNFSSVSYLQDNRNISKTSSINPNSNCLNMVKFSSGLKNLGPNQSNFNFFEKNVSYGMDKLSHGHFTRNKTKVFNLEGGNRFCREESDPAYRQSVFNETNQFHTADHYFGLQNFSHPFDKFQTSNPSNIVREISIPKVKKIDPPRMPPLKAENFQNNNRSTREMSHPYMSRSSHTASFGQINLRNGKNISTPIACKSKSSATKFVKKDRILNRSASK